MEENVMTINRAGAVVLLAVVALMGNSCSKAHSPPNPQIGWVHSQEMAMSLARQHHLPILIFVTSDSCTYCRKMEREVWSNPQIVSMVETGFIPLALNSERDATIVDALGIRAFPTTLLFTEEATFVTRATGYLPPNQLAALLRSGQQLRSASKPATRNQ
jgi:thioredoxin-related protein